MYKTFENCDYVNMAQVYTLRKSLLTHHVPSGVSFGSSTVLLLISTPTDLQNISIQALALVSALLQVACSFITIHSILCPPPGIDFVICHLHDHVLQHHISSVLCKPCKAARPSPSSSPVKITEKEDSNLHRITQP